MGTVTVQSLEELDCAEWDEAVSRMPGATYSQSSHFARFRQEQNRHCTAGFLRCRDSNGEARLLVSVDAPYTSLADRGGAAGMAGKIAAPLLGGFRTAGWNYGPVYSPGADRRELLPALLDGAESMARGHGAFMIRNVLPAIHDPQADPETEREIYSQRGYRIQPSATVLLRLDGRDTEQLWSGLAKDARRTVRKALGQGVEVAAAGDENDVRDYYRIRAQTASRNGVSIPPEEHFLRMFRAYPGGVYRFFVSRAEGELISGQGAAVFGDNVILGGVCYSDYARENSIYGNDLMQWHVIEWAVAHGAKTIDWGGYFIDPGDDTHKHGINRFKLKWGGGIHYFDSFSKVLSKPKAALYDAARRIFPS